MSLHHPVSIHTFPSPYRPATQRSHGQEPMWHHREDMALQHPHTSPSGFESSTLSYRSGDYARRHRRHAPRVDQANGVSSWISSAHTHQQSWETESLQGQTMSYPDSPTLSCSSVSQRVRPSSPCGSNRLSAQGSRTEIPPDEREPLDTNVAMIGSWCTTNLEHPAAHPNDLFETEKDALLDDWYPITPRESRLPTPDLAPLCMHYEFCTCCQNEEDRINENWYMTSRAKINDQRRLSALCPQVATSNTLTGQK
ncbi:hypothetical protein B0J13DRAFT_557197 [Dactylonectria estremocensis]|uniref:Uncharacterized protein n=1 Tax=Dactylonectria estremocensis TaxID=1079267 RepID=A0A9P9EN26_9HYPO|nr:hypothetical protein B0J13DRAFT_557197 [Dactylonectria estremocensis]